MKNFDFKSNGMTKVIAMILATIAAVGLISSTAIKLVASTYYLQYKRQLKTNIPVVDEIIDAVVDNRIPFVPVEPEPPVTEPSTEAPTTQAPTTEPSTEAPSEEPSTEAPSEEPSSEPEEESTEPAGDSGSGDILGTITGLLGGIDLGGIGDTVGGLLGDIDIGGLLGGITGGGSEEESTTEPTESTTESKESIKQKKAVLAEYNTVVNLAKKTAKPSFQKVTYRTLEKGVMDSVLLHSIEAAYPEYFVSKDNAAAAPIVVPANKATNELLINNDNYAGMLAAADAADAIESATSVKLEDGTKKIVITRKSEANPEVTAPDAKKAASFTSAMFPVISAQEFADMVAPTLKLTSVSSADIVYSGCTVELIYKPGVTAKIISINQTTNYTAEVKGTLLSCKGNVTEISEYTNFDYNA